MDFYLLAELMSLFHRAVLAVLFGSAGLMALFLLRNKLPDALRTSAAKLPWHGLMPIITASIFSRLVFFPRCSLTIIEENLLRISWGDLRPTYGGYLTTYILGDWLGADRITAAVLMLAFEAFNISMMIIIWWLIRNKVSLKRLVPVSV